MKDKIFKDLDSIVDTMMSELSEDSKKKIFIITDINKMYHLYLKRNISVYEFDSLYDTPIHRLERVLVNVQDQLEREQAYKSVTFD